MSSTASTSYDDTLRAFREAVGGAAEDIPLARAALLIAQTERPGLDIEAYERRLHDIAETLEQQLAQRGRRSTPRLITRTINQLLFRELGFRGSAERYDDPRNLYLDYVLDERQGIPVTLALVYTEVAQRVGLDIAPVGLPGHVIVRFQPEGTSEDYDALLLDVYSGGRPLTQRDCQVMVRNHFGARAEFKPHFLSAMTPRQVLQRLLHNLKAGYLQRGDEERAQRVIELLLTLFPWDLDEIRDRGMLRERMGDYPEALTDLEQYVQYRRGARDIQTVTETVRSLRRHAGGASE